MASTNDLQFGPSFMRGRTSKPQSGTFKSPLFETPSGIPAPTNGPTTPSLGAFAAPLGSPTVNGLKNSTTPSFSSIVSPERELDARLGNGGGGVNGHAEGVGGLSKKRGTYEYSREVLLSLYVEEKAMEFPVELDRSAVAISELLVGPPLGLQEMNEAEKELFSGPFNSDRRNVQHHTTLNTKSSSNAQQYQNGTPENGVNGQENRLSAGGGGVGGRPGKRQSTERFVSLGIQGGVLSGVAVGTGQNSGARRKGEGDTDVSDTLPRRYSRQDDPTSPGGATWSSARDRKSKDGGEGWGSKWKRGQSLEDKAPEGGTVAKYSVLDRMRERANAANIDSPEPAKEETLESTADVQDALAAAVDSVRLDDAVDDNPETSIDATSTDPPSSTLTNGHTNPDPDPIPESHSFENASWVYQDSTGQLQGPFPVADMQAWHAAGHFQLYPNLLMKRTTDTGFESYGNLVLNAADPGRPFHGQRAPPPLPVLQTPVHAPIQQQVPSPPTYPEPASIPPTNNDSFDPQHQLVESQPTPLQHHSPSTLGGYGPAAPAPDPWNPSPVLPASNGVALPWNTPQQFQQPPYGGPGPFGQPDPFRFQGHPDLPGGGYGPQFFGPQVGPGHDGLFNRSPVQGFGMAPPPPPPNFAQHGGFPPSPFLNNGMVGPGPAELDYHQHFQQQFQQQHQHLAQQQQIQLQLQQQQLHLQQQQLQQQQQQQQHEEGPIKSLGPSALEDPWEQTVDKSDAISPIALPGATSVGPQPSGPVRQDSFATRAAKPAPIGPRASGKNTPVDISPKPTAGDLGANAASHILPALNTATPVASTTPLVEPASAVPVAVLEQVIPEPVAAPAPAPAPEPTPAPTVVAPLPSAPKAPVSGPKKATLPAKPITVTKPVDDSDDVATSPWKDVSAAASLPPKPVSSVEVKIPVSPNGPGGKVSVMSRSQQEEQHKRAASIAKAQMQLKEAQAVERAAKEAAAAAAAAASSPATAAPWSKEEKKPAAGPSLAEIQAIEAKQAEKRRAAEKQALANRLAAEQAANAERAAKELREGLPSTTTWAANGGQSSAQAKPASPVAWLKETSAEGAPKQTMKQIQEEEAKRKRAELAAVANVAKGTLGVRAGYAGSVGPAARKPPTAVAGPWSVVGKGKVATPPQSQSTGRLPGSVPGLPGSARTVATPVIAAPAPSPARPPVQPRTVSTPGKAAASNPDAPPAASAEFMKWLREALKGMTNVDDFVKMLLDFPVNLDDSVLEIISDSVYAGSATLDGRRFAREFQRKRQQDFADRIPKAPAASSSATPKKTSMADALKAQPQQPASLPWGFAVVSKKGKKK